MKKATQSDIMLAAKSVLDKVGFVMGEAEFCGAVRHSLKKKGLEV
jgi:hypothetical protein